MTKIPKPHLIGIKITTEEKEMLNILRQHPHYLNIPQYFRDCIHHIYKQKINKISKPKETKETKEDNEPK